MKCPNCKSDIDGKVDSCPHCGRALHAWAITRSIIYIILGIIMVILAAPVAYCAISSVPDLFNKNADVRSGSQTQLLIGGLLSALFGYLIFRLFKEARK